MDRLPEKFAQSGIDTLRVNLHINVRHRPQDHLQSLVAGHRSQIFQNLGYEVPPAYRVEIVPGILCIQDFSKGFQGFNHAVSFLD